MAIISTTEYKAWRSISASTYDTILGVLIPAAQAALERYCERVFDSATFTDEAHDGNGSEWIIAKNTPITTMTSVETLDNNGTATVVASTDYRHDPLSGRIFRLGAGRGRIVRDSWGDIAYPEFGVQPCWPEGFQNILVTYVGGYSSQTMPTDLKLLMYKLVDALFFEVKDGITGNDPLVSSEKLGDYSYTRATKTLSDNETLRTEANQFRRVYS